MLEIENLVDLEQQRLHSQLVLSLVDFAHSLRLHAVDTDRRIHEFVEDLRVTIGLLPLELSVDRIVSVEQVERRGARLLLRPLQLVEVLRHL